MAMVVAAEDDQNVRELVVRALREAGHSVVPVADGTAAVLAVREHRPDVVVVDGVMPGLTGVQVCRALRDDPQLASIPVVMFSGALPSDSGAAAQVPCVDAAVRKSISSMGELVAVVEDVLR